MVWLADWYRQNSGGKGLGFFQIGGGIAGDFPICVVPMMYQDLEWHDVPFWNYFCQVSDFYYLLRFLLRCGAQRENNLGQIRHSHPEVYY